MIYNFSEKTVENRKNLLLIVGLVYFGLILLFLLLYAPKYFARGGSIGPFLLVPFVVFIILGLTFYLAWRISAKNLRSKKLNITVDSITFVSGSPSWEVDFPKITKVTFYSNPDVINLFSENKKFVVFGYEKMDEIIKTIEMKVDSSIIKRVERKIDWTKPIPIVFMLFAGIVFFILLMFFGKITGTGRLFQPLFLISIGSYFAIWGPINLMKNQKLLGWVLILFGILQFFTQFPFFGISVGK